LDLNPVLETMIYKAKFTYRLKDSFSVESRQPIAFMVMRDRFDQFLVKQALEKGTEVLEGVRVVKVEEKRDGVEVELNEGEKIRCEYLIGADGSGSIVGKSLSLLPPKGDGNGFGMESEIPYESTSDFPREERQLVHLDFGGVPNGYGWVFPRRRPLHRRRRVVERRSKDESPSILQYVYSWTALHQARESGKSYRPSSSVFL
jgi:flavin-dependent dehydrogenase